MGPNINNCMLEAYKLHLGNGGTGEVCHVPSVGHTYYIPDPTDLDAIALNHEDNGFGRYARLTVREVLKLHDPRYLLITSD